MNMNSKHFQDFWDSFTSSRTFPGLEMTILKFQDFSMSVGTLSGISLFNERAVDFISM